MKEARSGDCFRSGGSGMTSLRILHLIGHLHDKKEPAVKRSEGRKSSPG